MQAGAGQVDEHLRELALDHLVLVDRLAEDLSLAGILDRRLVGRPGHTQAAGRMGDPALLERRHHVGHAAPLFPEKRVFRHLAIEVDDAGFHRAVAELVHLVDLDPRQVAVDEEDAQPVAPLVAIGVDHDQHEIRNRRPGGVDLVGLDVPARGGARRGAPHRQHVRARARFGHSEGRQLFAADDRGEVAVDLLGRSVGRDQPLAEAQHGRAEPGADPGEFLDHDAGVQQRAAGPAEFLGDRQAEKPVLGRLRDQFPRVGPRGFGAVHQRADFLLREPPARVAEAAHLLVFDHLRLRV